jgi:hypothetical protein
MIYFIRIGTAVKIGFTESNHSLKTRMKAIQSCSPHKIQLERTIRGSKLKERCLHGFCIKSHLHGEWFILTKGQVDELASKYENWNPAENNIKSHSQIHHLTAKR